MSRRRFTPALKLIRAACFFFFFPNRNYTRPLFLSKSEPEDTHHSQWIYCDVSIHTCTNIHKRTERVKDREGERARKHSYCRQCYMIKGDGERRGNESSKNGSAADSVSPGSHSLQIHASTHTHACSALSYLTKGRARRVSHSNRGTRLSLVWGAEALFPPGGVHEYLGGVRDCFSSLLTGNSIRNEGKVRQRKQGNRIAIRFLRESTPEYGAITSLHKINDLFNLDRARKCANFRDSLQI